MRQFFLAFPFIILGFIGVWYFSIYKGGFHRLWISADREAQQFLDAGKEKKAVDTFENRLFIGAIYFKNGSFKKALELYESVDSKEGFYNCGNTFFMLGKYDEAISAYELALEVDKNFTVAKENRALAILRKEEREKYGAEEGEGTDGKLKADEILFDNKAKKGQDILMEEDKGENGTKEQWLDRLQTSPSGFLKAKFHYQYQVQKRDKG